MSLKFDLPFLFKAIKLMAFSSSSNEFTEFLSNPFLTVFPPQYHGLQNQILL